MRTVIVTLLLLAVTLSAALAATEGTDRSPIRNRPIGPLRGLLKPKSATAFDTLVIERGDTNGAWVQQRPAVAQTLVSGATTDSVGTNRASAFRLFAGAIDVSSYTGGALEVVALCADSVEADSLVHELFAFASGTSLVAGLVPMDTDDSNGPKLDGWLLTTLDSTRLSVPENVTPITGAAASVIKWPYHLSSRVVPGQHARTVSGVAVPGAEALEYGGLTGVNTAQRLVSYWIPLTDGFGNYYNVKTLQVALLNRHPRRGGENVTWTIKFWPKAN